MEYLYIPDRLIVPPSLVAALAVSTVVACNDDSSARHPGIDVCTECVESESAATVAALPYSPAELEAQVVGHWEGRHPAGFGLDEFEFRLSVVGDAGSDIRGVEARRSADAPPDCSPIASACHGLNFPVRVEATGVPFAIPATSVVRGPRMRPDWMPIASGESLGGQDDRDVPLLVLEASTGYGELVLRFDPDGALWIHADDGVHDGDPDEPAVYYRFERISAK